MTFGRMSKESTLPGVFGLHACKDFVIAGNLLVGNTVIEAMAHAFKGSEGSLAERLMRALEAGQLAGGDKRGRVSAALLVTSAKDKAALPILDLRVDEHDNPSKN